jgi:hypothetical protein
MMNLVSRPQLNHNRRCMFVTHLREAFGGEELLLATGRSRVGGGATSQTASRLLLAMDKLGEGVADGHPVEGAVKVIQSLSLLIKIDFWIRNPDYLADELLTEIEEQRQPPALLQRVASMIGGRAPALHRYPMAKYLYGAYERPDNSLALLASQRLIRHVRISNAAKARRDYYLLQKGADAAEAMRSEVPVLSWYDAQADAISLLPEAKMGSQARRRQYEQPEYEMTPWGAIIPEITVRVRGRALKIADKFGFPLVLEPLALASGEQS